MAIETMTQYQVHSCLAVMAVVHGSSSRDGSLEVDLGKSA